MRIGYCLLVHKNPAQVARLIRAIRCDEDLVYVNVFRVGDFDKKNWEETINEDDNLKVSFGYGRSEGSFRQVSATLDAMDWFSGREYDYFINLSGQCYPIKSRKDIEKRLGEDNASHIGAKQLPCADWPACSDLSRFNQIYFKIPNLDALRTLARRKHADKSTFVGIRRFWPSLLDSTTFYGGEQWFILKASHVEYLRQLLASNAAFQRFFRRVLIPDEHFFQTLLMNSPCREEIVPESLTYVDWSRLDGSRPRILTMEDYEKLRKSRCLFARKFDIHIDQGILDRIDAEMVHGNTCSGGAKKVATAGDAITP